MSASAEQLRFMANAITESLSPLERVVRNAAHLGEFTIVDDIVTIRRIIIRSRNEIMETASKLDNL